MPRTSSPLRRFPAVLGAALLTAIWVAGISFPASAAPVKAYLQVTSIIDQETRLGGTVPRPLGDNPDITGPVQNKPFDVAVRVVDRDPNKPGAQPIALSKATTIELTASGPGGLVNKVQAVIPRDGSSATLTGAMYTKFANGVVLTVGVVSGVALEADKVPVAVAFSAVRDEATPGTPKTVTDLNCAAPTTAVPNCGRLLLPNGANGQVILSVGSCVGLCPPRPDRSIQALVVTAIASLKDVNGDQLYSNAQPATLIIACDKDLCRETANGVPKIPVYYSTQNTGPVTTVAAECPEKGVLGPRQVACVDYVSSSRQQGDLYLHLLFDIDMRGSM